MQQATRQKSDVGIQVKELPATSPLASKQLITETLLWYTRLSHLVPSAGSRSTATKG